MECGETLLEASTGRLGVSTKDLLRCLGATVPQSQPPALGVGPDVDANLDFGDR